MNKTITLGSLPVSPGGVATTHSETKVGGALSHSLHHHRTDRPLPFLAVVMMTLYLI